MWLTNMSGDAYVDIVKMAEETYLQHTTMLITLDLIVCHILSTGRG